MCKSILSLVVLLVICKPKDSLKEMHSRTGSQCIECSNETVLPRLAHSRTTGILVVYILYGRYALGTSCSRDVRTLEAFALWERSYSGIVWRGRVTLRKKKTKLFIFCSLLLLSNLPITFTIFCAGQPISQSVIIRFSLTWSGKALEQPRRFWSKLPPERTV